MFGPLFALSALMFAAAPAAAASYAAKPANVAPQRLITSDIVWNCGTGACQGNTDESRPVVICQSLARHVGKIDSFVVNGREIAAADLDRCNSAAKAQPAKALAAH